jgi:outer membrane protein assembly factor BamB
MFDLLFDSQISGVLLVKNTYRMLFPALLLVSSLAQAENWSKFRGPTGQGLSAEKNLPAEWSTTKNVAWKVDVAGEGWSSPVVVDGRVYLTAAVTPTGGTGKDRSLRTLCLDVKTGKTLWNVEVFSQTDAATDRIHGKNSHASPTPIVDGNNIYVHFGTQGTARLTLDGKIGWKTKELVYAPQHGNGGSPVLVDGVLVICCDGRDVQYIAGIDSKTGKLRWKKDRPDVPGGKKFAFATPLAITVGGKQQVICPGTDVVSSVEPATGKEIWRVLYSGFSVIPCPIFVNGLVYISTSYGTPSVIAIRPDGKGDVTETHVVWQAKRGAPHTPSLLAIGDEIYYVSDRGVATCSDAKTGEIHWQERVGGNYSASPVFADGKIYLQSEQGKTTVLRPGKAYEVLALNDLEERTLASYAVSDSSLFIRTATKLYRIKK